MTSQAKSKFRRLLLIVTSVLFFGTTNNFAQESSSKTQTSATPISSESNTSFDASTPTSALRDALSAACAHNQQNFLRSLTARNKESFSRLTNSARVSLMKRFVLLDEVGKPSVTTNPAGRPVVHCETPSVTTEMQIGGAELRDNVAFLPLDLRDSTDGSGASAHVITMGMVRENGEWKILSLGVMMLDLPSLEVEWDAADMETNEQAAFKSLKSLAAAVETYRKTYSHIPESLADLGPVLHGAPTKDAANLIDSDLAKGAKSGYSFRYVIIGANTTGAPAKFQLAASPTGYGRSGRKSFFYDADGTFHAADHKGAVGSAADPTVE